MRLAIVVAALALGSCAIQPPPPSRPDASFAQELAGRVAGPPLKCVTTITGESLRPIDSRTIAYGFGRTIYVNHLPDECPGLQPLNTLIVEMHGGQYCRLDRVRAVESNSIIPGASCTLGDWMAYRRP